MNITPVCPKHWRYRGNYFIFCKRVVFSVLFHSTQKSLLQYEQMCDIVVLHRFLGATVGIIAFHRGRCNAPKQSRIFDNFIARAGKCVPARQSTIPYSRSDVMVNIKTVQENLGHATAAFTLDVFGHVTEQMKRDSANRMQKYIQNVRR